MTEEEHERRKRIRTNPFTGTFHFFPGRYSSLHGLKRFRGAKKGGEGGEDGFLGASFDELDRMAALGRRVTQKVKEADNPAFAAVFLNGVFSVSPLHQMRRSLYPFKTKEGAAWYAELTQSTQGLPRYRYGGAVDTSRKFGCSLDDCCLTALRSTLTAPSLLKEILYKWNGFRLHYFKRMRPCVLYGHGYGQGRRESEGNLLDVSSSSLFMMTRRSSMTHWRRDSASSLASLMHGGGWW